MLSVSITRRRLRRTTVVMLFAWMLALLASGVNACLVQRVMPGTDSHALGNDKPMIDRAAGVAQTERPFEHAHHRSDADHDAGRSADAGKAGCLKFCADESSALAKNKTTHSDPPGPALLVGAHWRMPAPVAVVAQWPAAERPASVGPPLFLRLLRLTI